MSDNNIKWIPLVGMDLSAANLAAAEKLRRFGFSLICGEFGSEKLTKTGLCIYDVLSSKEKPNILIITSNKELYGWYRILITGIGADFKIITGASNAVVFFSEDCPNLCLMSSDALSKPNGLRAKAGNDFVWDLIIIDEEQSCDVPDYGFYREQLPWKAEKLLIVSPFPAKNDEDRSELISLIKKIMADEGLSAAADNIKLDSNASMLDSDSPVMRYYDTRVYTGELKREVIFREYGFDESALSGLHRRIDLRSGLPVYKFGGNVFEEYDCDEMKELYSKSAYTRTDVEDLRAFDKKLDSFLALVDELLSDENNRAVVYCSDKNTMEYLRKTLTAVYNGQGVIRASKGELFSSEDILRKLRVDDSTVYPRVVLGVDGLGAVGDALDRINCVINYELPASAALLERRMTRHGSKNEAERRFYIFRDKNGIFDSRILDKVLYGGLLSGLCGGLPSRNILLETDAKAKCMNTVIGDLKYASSYAKEVDNCYDLIKRFKGDYALLGADKLSTAKQLADFSGRMLDRLCEALGISPDAGSEEITAAVNALDGLCAFNGGKLEKLPADKLNEMAESFNNSAYTNLPFASEAVGGLEEAKRFIDELHKNEDFHYKVKTELASLNDCIQYPVLFGIWRYRVREQDSDRSFRDYIKIYNDGI